MSAIHPGTIAVIVVVSICFTGIVIVCALHFVKKYKSKQSDRDRLPTPEVVDHDPRPHTGCCAAGLFRHWRTRGETGTAWTAGTEKEPHDKKSKLPPPEIDLNFLPFPTKKGQLPPLTDTYNRATLRTDALFSKNVHLSATATSKRIPQVPPGVPKHMWK